jgi:hypothetical protein
LSNSKYTPYSDLKDRKGSQYASFFKKNQSSLNCENIDLSGNSTKSILASFILAISTLSFGFFRNEGNKNFLKNIYTNSNSKSINNTLTQSPSKYELISSFIFNINVFAKANISLSISKKTQ